MRNTKKLSISMKAGWEKRRARKVDYCKRDDLAHVTPATE